MISLFGKKKILKREKGWTMVPVDRRLRRQAEALKSATLITAPFFEKKVAGSQRNIL